MKALNLNRRLVILACYIVAGVLMSAYGASRMLTGAAHEIARTTTARQAQIAGAER